MRGDKLIPIGLAVLLMAPVVASAQPLDLPRPSPNAKVMQVVGLTEITVEYSSPAVRGRTIWGALVPWGEVWRAGANAATKITFDKDVTFGAVTVPAGSYAIFVQPNKTGPWTVIINRDWKQSGAFAYKKESDVVRLDVKPQAIPPRERLAYSFSDFGNAGGTLNLEWEKVRLPIAFKVNTDAQAAANIATYQDSTWMPFNQAARYMLEQKKDYDAGLALVEKSIAAKETWFNVWTKAQLLAEKGDKKDALALAQRAQELGSKNPQGFFFAAEVKKALTDWAAPPKGAPAKK
jgi:hypothetical protein